MTTAREKHRIASRIDRINSKTDAARESIRAATGDSFANVASRLGYGAGSQQDSARYKIDFISRNWYQLEAAYRSNWVCGMAVDVVAEDMTRAGIEFQSDNLTPEDAAIIHSEFETLRIWNELGNVVRWGRLYGGAIGVLLIEGQRMETPLIIDRVGEGQFKGIVALDRWQVQPSLNDLVTDLGPDLGMPKFYQVNAGAKTLVNEKIHYSRVIRMVGLELPWRQMMAENMWGQSVLERLWDRLVNFDSATAGAGQLIYKAHLRTMKVKGFRELVATGGKLFEAFIEQMKLIRQFQGIEGMTVVDGNDEFDTHQYTFAGLADMLLQFGQQLSGALQIPLVRLFGQSPAGMNSTGESDLRTYYDGIATQQDQKLRPGVGRIAALISLSKLKKPLPPGFAFSFAPLWQMTDTDKATVAKTTTEAVMAAEASGIISPATAAKELRQVSRATGVFSHITDDDINQLDAEPPSPDDVAPEDEPKKKPTTDGIRSKITRLLTRSRKG